MVSLKGQRTSTAPEPQLLKADFKAERGIDLGLEELQHLNAGIQTLQTRQDFPPQTVRASARDHSHFHCVIELNGYCSVGSVSSPQHTKRQRH